MGQDLALSLAVSQANPNELNDAIRDMLLNWARWEKRLEPAIPLDVPAKQPMFREVKSGYNAEDGLSRKNTVWPRYEEAMFSESLITRMTEHDRSVLIRYFVRHQNTIICAQKARMSRRKFEQWLNNAIGKFAARVEDSDEGLGYIYLILRDKR